MLEHKFGNKLTRPWIIQEAWILKWSKNATIDELQTVSYSNMVILTWTRRNLKINVSVGHIWLATSGLVGDLASVGDIPMVTCIINYNYEI